MSDTTSTEDLTAEQHDLTQPTSRTTSRATTARARPARRWRGARGCRGS